MVLLNEAGLLNIEFWRARQLKQIGESFPVLSNALITSLERQLARLELLREQISVEYVLFLILLVIGVRTIVVSIVTAFHRILHL